MMLKKLLLYSCIVILVACSSKQKPDPSKYIPKETALVLVINTPLLIDKIKTNAFIQLDSVLKDMLTKKDNDDFQKQIEKLNESIDLKEKIYLFATPKYIGGKYGISVNFIAYLKDAEKLETTLKENKTWKSISITKTEHFTYALIENKFELSWNKDVVMLSINPEKDSKQYDFKTHTTQFVPADTATLIKQVTKYYNLTENESVAGIKQFKELQKEPADLYTFSNSAFLTNFTSQLTIQPVRLDSFISNNYYAVTFHFEKGKVRMNGAIYLNDALKNLTRKYRSTVVNTAILNNYPSTDVNSFILSSFNPAIIEGLINDLDVAVFTDVFLKRAGINNQDITQSLKGDLSIIFSDFSTSKTSTNSNCMIEASIGNKNSTDKLMGLISNVGFLHKKGNDYTVDAELPLGANIHIDNNSLLFYSNPLLYNKYLLGNNKNNIPDNIKQATNGKSSAGYIHIDSYLNGIDDLLLNEISGSAKEVKSLLKSTLQDAFVTSDTLNNGEIKVHGELRLKDTIQNSLIQLHNMTMHITEKVSKARKEYDKTLLHSEFPSH